MWIYVQGWLRGGQTYSDSGTLKGPGKRIFIISTENEEARCIIYVEEEAPQTGSIKVYVKDDDGNKLSGASVHLDSNYEGKSNSSGYLYIEDVSEGYRTIKASKSGYENDSKRVRVDTGGIETVNLRLKKEVTKEKEKKNEENQKEDEKRAEEITRHLGFAPGYKFYPADITSYWPYSPVPFHIAGGNVRYRSTLNGYEIFINCYMADCTPRDDLIWDIQLFKRGTFGWSFVHTEEADAKEGYGCDRGHKIVEFGHNKDYKLNYLIKQDESTMSKFAL